MGILEIIQSAGGWGVGGFLGLIIFLMYRQDRRASEKRLSMLLEQDHQTREDHTKALTELITWLKQRNGNAR